jgi:photosynthetic reaction center cytochrome c subunit
MGLGFAFIEESGISTFPCLLHCQLASGDGFRMKNEHYARLRTLAAVLFVCVAVVVASGQTGPATATTLKAKMTEEAYKNIQSLKGIPADQLLPAMQFITYSLGVECSYCHVQEAFEKDDKKPKLAARKMMQMMFAINHDNFEGKRAVTCYSCHRGSSHPVSTPIIADTGAQSIPEVVRPEEDDQSGPVPPDLPSADQILARYVDALGGASAIGKLSTRVEKGTINLGGRQLAIEIFSKVPGKRMTVIHLPNGDSVTTYDGISGWTSAPDRPVRDIPVPEIASARPELDLQLPVRLRQLFTDVKTGKPEKIGDRDVYVVSGLNAGKLAARFYFDESSGLLLRLLRYVDSPLGRNPTQIDYADYRDQGGIKLPFQRTVSRPGTRFAIQIEEARGNVPVDDAKFVRPAEASANPPSP